MFLPLDETMGLETLLKKVKEDEIPRMDRLYIKGIVKEQL